MRCKILKSAGKLSFNFSIFTTIVVVDVPCPSKYLFTELIAVLYQFSLIVGQFSSGSKQFIVTVMNVTTELGAWPLTISGNMKHHTAY